MSFVHPLLLGGLLLVGIPVLIHLIMQQKPKRLPFPAFRFLVQKVRTNQRRLRLRHLLLLLLRMALIALLCLALARPMLLNPGSVGLVGDRPAAVAIVIDTSPTMDYKDGGKTRLEEARQRALELLDELPENSRVAVFDSAEFTSGEWLPTPALVRERLEGLQIKPANAPITDAIAQALRLLNALDDEPDLRTDPLPRFLYVFSDRTEASWDRSRAQALSELRERSKHKPLPAYVDVGVAKPEDLAIADVKMPRQLVPANGRVIIHALVQATGKDYPDVEVRCRIDGEKEPARQVVKVKAGTSEQVTFERLGLPLGVHQAEITLAGNDALAFNNARFATFEVTGPRRVLTVCDDPDDAAFWKLALKVGERVGEPSFDTDVKTPRELRELTPADLGRYQAVCLLAVAAPDADLWAKLERYVTEGGGLVVVPGGDAEIARYNDDVTAQKLLPGTLGKQVHNAQGAAWKDSTLKGPLRDWFDEWKRQVDPPIDFIRLPPVATRWWEVQPGTKAFLLAFYADDRPAVLERNFAGEPVRGRVLLLTTAFDRRLAPTWNDYLTSSFYVAIVKRVVGYLSGDAREASLNHLARPQQAVVVPLPPEGRFPNYVLQGPGLGGQAGLIARTDSQNELHLAQAVQAGNFILVADEERWRTGFSLNVPPDESRLDQVPVEKIEEALGPKAVLPVGHGINFREALQGHWSQPVELLPYLMIALLLALALENLLANRFYKRPREQATESA